RARAAHAERGRESEVVVVRTEDFDGSADLVARARKIRLEMRKQSGEDRAGPGLPVERPPVGEELDGLLEGGLRPRVLAELVERRAPKARKLAAQRRLELRARLVGRGHPRRRVADAIVK